MSHEPHGHSGDIISGGGKTVLPDIAAIRKIAIKIQ
jgi:nickel-dependent lactate racemase